MVIIKREMVPIDIHSIYLGTIHRLFLQNIFFFVQHTTETHTSLEQHEGE